MASKILLDAVCAPCTVKGKYPVALGTTRRIRAWASCPHFGANRLHYRQNSIPTSASAPEASKSERSSEPLHDPPNAIFGEPALWPTTEDEREAVFRRMRAMDDISSFVRDVKMHPLRRKYPERTERELLRMVGEAIERGSR